MTGLPEFFKQTCDKPYDKHSYKFVGHYNREMIFDTWEQVKSYWFHVPSQFKSHIEVIDKKKKTTGGFK